MRTVIVRSNNNSSDKNGNKKYQTWLYCRRVTDVNAACILKKYCISDK